MKILLSPAKKLNFESESVTNIHTEPIFLKEANSLVGKLSRISTKKLQGMMHLSEALTQLNKKRYTTWEIAETKQAALAFNGEVYSGLNASSWSDSDFNYAQGELRILSGLYGILKPMDLIKPYRLEMGSKWQISPTKPNLYKHWKKSIATQLEKEMTEDEVILNLASVEYSKALLPHIISKRKIITAEFREFKNGEYKMIQVFVKKARGMMAKYIIQNQITNTEEIINFNEDSYQFDANLSSENKMVFTR